MTTAWSFNVAYEHYWKPQEHASFIGSYLSERYDVQANAVSCPLIGAGIGAEAVATLGCNNNRDF